MPRKKKTKPMDPSTGMREFLDREAEHRRQEEQAAFEIAADRSLGDAWRQGWKKLELAIPAYLAGESSRTMVDEISELDKLVDAVGYAGQLIRLREADAFPKLESLDGEFHLAICRVVTAVWVGLRFDAADPDELVNTLDANNDRKPINDATFVRHFIENGGLPTCPQCGKPQAPADIRRGRCESCRLKDRTLLIALQTAIECERRYGREAVYTGGVEAHYPQWSQWKTRLADYIANDDASDHDLWRSWVNYVRRKHGLDRATFLRIQIDDAETLLPPANTFLAREQDNLSQTRNHDSNVVATGTAFRPEASDDDLWLQLDICIRALEAVAGAACVVIRDWNIGTESDSRYLKNINELATKAGWKPFVFPREHGLEVVRTNGETAFCYYHRDSCSVDDVGGEAVLSALRAWREKRTGELRSMSESSATSGAAATHAAGASTLQTDNSMLSDLAKSIDRLSESVSKPKTRGRKATQSEDGQDWRRVYREYEGYTAPKGFKPKETGDWTNSFEAFWLSRDDLQAFTLASAWRKMEAARKQIARRSR